MFADVADKPTSARALAMRGALRRLRACMGISRKTVRSRKVHRGLRLNMANNPKKVKDPTEVALSAIQEALNISDAPAADHARGSANGDDTPRSSSSQDYNESVFNFNEGPFDTRPSTDRPSF